MQETAPITEDAPGEEEVARDLDRVGCPILSDDVTVCIHRPFKP